MLRSTLAVSDDTPTGGIGFTGIAEGSGSPLATRANGAVFSRAEARLFPPTAAIAAALAAPDYPEVRPVGHARI